jgi:hypothetical protein
MNRLDLKKGKKNSSSVLKNARVTLPKANELEVRRKIRYLLHNILELSHYAILIIEWTATQAHTGIKSKITTSKTQNLWLQDSAVSVQHVKSNRKTKNLLSLSKKRLTTRNLF